MQWYLNCWKKYVDFNGRSRRKEYWMFVLFNILASIVVSIVGSLLLRKNGVILSGLYNLAVFLPSLAVLIRRLHDIGKKWYWIFISLIPLAGPIWMLVLLCTEGEGDNEFGPDPKAETTEA
ncbi:DUF805 domain-containing protein [Acetivibrio sp. MSJd-27]|uniref:DUF805 domain-containing protein n=1 Tax=Acetivibrio sp. MSJd-27 TaxID=2841523 RepID=UPI001C10D6D2|nr:DUF805 domain-containing protein [Acetivibrio sp. MSJd-27]MBU5449863.1 DUF805 domain-containing protein [Acetivibrio sp. MSJd-27]